MTTYDQMQKRIAELREEFGEPQTTEISTSLAEIRMNERDAARYRWLRNTQNMDCRDSGENMDKIGTIESIMVVESMGGSSAPWPDELDAAIDTAMKANP